MIKIYHNNDKHSISISNDMSKWRVHDITNARTSESSLANYYPKQ